MSTASRKGLVAYPLFTDLVTWITQLFDSLSPHLFLFSTPGFRPGFSPPTTIMFSSLVLEHILSLLAITPATQDNSFTSSFFQWTYELLWVMPLFFFHQPQNYLVFIIWSTFVSKVNTLQIWSELTVFKSLNFIPRWPWALILHLSCVFSALSLDSATILFM